MKFDLWVGCKLVPQSWSQFQARPVGPRSWGLPGISPILKLLNSTSWIKWILKSKK